MAKPDASLGSQVLHSVSKRAYAGRVTQEAVCNLFSLLLLLRDGTGDLHGQTWMANEIFERRNWLLAFVDHVINFR